MDVVEVFRDGGAPGASDEQSEYELERRRNIETNQRFLDELGLNSPNSSPTKRLRGSSASPSSSPRRLSRNEYLSSPERKSSRRLQGIEPEAVSELEILAVAEESDYDEQLAKVAAVARLKKQLDRCRMIWTGWRQVPRTEIRVVMLREIHMPMTLQSIGTTVFDVGRLYKGPLEHLYWSNRMSLFLHPYPIGYRAEKTHFGAVHQMAIDEGPDGPVFTVTRAGGPTWTGNFPTAPWTFACLYSRTPKTRVSGPLFYGFSDPIIQRLIQELPGYVEFSSLPIPAASESTSVEASAEAETASEQTETAPVVELIDEKPSSASSSPRSSPSKRRRR